MKQLRIIIPVCFLIGFAVAFFNRPPAEEKKAALEKSAPVEVVKEAEVSPVEDPQMRIFLVIGKSVAADRSKNSEQGKIIERCFHLNQSNVWEPVIDGNLYEHEFAKNYLEKNPSRTLGLVVNTRPESSINQWLDRQIPETRAAKQRVKFATQSGKMSGVIWFQGNEQSEDGLLDKIKMLVNDYRSHLIDPNLPFVIADIRNSSNMNSISELSKSVHLTESVTYGEWESDIGKLCAEQMIKMEALHLKMTPKPPTDLKLIDPHVHAMSVTPLGLRAVANWMDERNVERCIVSPLMHKGSHPQNEEEYQIMLENFRPYKGKIDRMCIINAGDVKTAEEAVTILKREVADGAIAFGEHYGVGLMFDDPKNLMLYEACEKVGIPVMFHIDQNKNMVEPGMERVDNVLKKYPKCNLVAHAYWWRQLGSGACDRQLQEHPNLYADMSGRVVIDVLNRDRAYAREFLIRNQDKILWATDEGWWSFGGKDKQMNQHYTFLEGLDLPDEVRRKIYRENSIKVYGLKKK
jgi:uncharacterized protein